MDAKKKAFFAALRERRFKEELADPLDPPGRYERQALPQDLLEHKPQILVKPQPKSLGRIGGFEI